MGKFIAGIIIGVVVLAAGAYVYVHYGFFDMRADKGVGKVEHIYMEGAMDRYADRFAPKLLNPIPATDANLIDGIRIYKSNCAVCHGGPDKPISELGAAFSPRVPQFVQDAPDMPENQNYWIVKHGVKMTGMPAWEKVLSDADIWKITTFLSKMGDMDKLSPEVQQAWKSGGQAELGAQQNPTAPLQPATPPPTPHKKTHEHHH